MFASFVPLQLFFMIVRFVFKTFFFFHGPGLPEIIVHTLIITWPVSQMGRMTVTIINNDNKKKCGTDFSLRNYSRYKNELSRRWRELTIARQRDDGFFHCRPHNFPTPINRKGKSIAVEHYDFVPWKLKWPLKAYFGLRYSSFLKNYRLTLWKVSTDPETKPKGPNSQKSTN